MKLGDGFMCGYGKIGIELDSLISSKKKCKDIGGIH